MLKIIVPAGELFDPKTETFAYTKTVELVLEHSLVAISKWESKWEIPFLNTELTTEQFIDYVRCMTITQNVDPNVYLVMNQAILNRIRTYMDAKMSAAVIHSDRPNNQRSTKFITADLIYYWMVALRIPFECQKWHLNRLLMLIRIAEIEQNPNKKLSKAESARRSQATNAARRAKMRKH